MDDDSLKLWLRGQEEIDWIKNNFPWFEEKSIQWLLDNRKKARRRYMKQDRSRREYLRSRPEKIEAARVHNERRREEFQDKTDDEKTEIRRRHALAQSRWRSDKREILAQKE
ncbi:hypothetical protein VKT23_015243 [Stygiomarasmius scandens]|uniref:Uncharacterized protein n=1 Tax=Marasmiellus scandens TaxID=2682957 RepID=A0ABR1J302_9AGAR